MGVMRCDRCQEQIWSLATFHICPDGITWDQRQRGDVLPYTGVRRMNELLNKSFLDRLTAYDIRFLSDRNIECDGAMLKAACEHPFA